MPMSGRSIFIAVLGSEDRPRPSGQADREFHRPSARPHPPLTRTPQSTRSRCRRAVLRYVPRACCDRGRTSTQLRSSRLRSTVAAAPERHKARAPATCQQGAESKTAQLAINERHPVDVVLAETPGYPLASADPCARLPGGLPHRPASQQGGNGPAPHPARAPTAGRRDLRPVTRTAPNLTSAAIGAMREDCPRA